MTEWSSTRLSADHDLVAFDCGQVSLDSWLRDEAVRAETQGTARTWVWTRPGSPTVEAYFSIAPTELVRDVLTSSQAGGATKVPSYLLARLALNRPLQGDRLGGDLLFNALERIVEAADSSGGRLVVVDALDGRAERFYSKFGFTPVRVAHLDSEEGKPPAPPAYPRRMVVKIATIRAAFGL